LRSLSKVDCLLIAHSQKTKAATPNAITHSTPHIAPVWLNLLFHFSNGYHRGSRYCLVARKFSKHLLPSGVKNCLLGEQHLSVLLLASLQIRHGSEGRRISSRKASHKWDSVSALEQLSMPCLCIEMRIIIQMLAQYQGCLLDFS
jgi:hypothetical protein